MHKRLEIPVDKEIGMFEINIEHIQPETIHPTLQPKAENVQHGLTDLGIAPVQIWLLAKIGVEIILPN